jgi:hypothetical protein
MAFLPGLKHDVFISYAHEDADWVDALQEQLTERLLHRLGTRCDVWQDENKIRTGQKWPDEIDRAIRDAAVFLAVISRNYPGSGWCEKELEAFFADAGPTGRFDAGGYGRFVKVVKFPWHLDAHDGFYPDFQHVLFFDRDSKTGQEREFKEHSAGFRLAVDKLSFHIERLFAAMLRGMSKVYVARAAAGIRDERDAIARQIKAEGYALTPPPDGVIPQGLDRNALKKFIGEAPVAIFVLGAGFDSVVRTQIDLAIEMDKRVIFCVAQNRSPAAPEQAQLLQSIRENRWGLPEGRWSLLESRSLMTLIQDLLLLLAPSRPTDADVIDPSSHVYLLCDPTTPEDAHFARQIQAHIHKREQIVVELPQVASEGVSSTAQHERLLSECDGLLVYYEKAPAKWYSRNLADLLTAEHKRRTRELRSKALFVANMAVAMPGLTVIHRSDPPNPLDPGQLEPFLAPLRRPPSSGPAPAQGHSSHVDD